MSPTKRNIATRPLRRQHLDKLRFEMKKPAETETVPASWGDRDWGISGNAYQAMLLLLSALGELTIIWVGVTMMAHLAGWAPLKVSSAILAKKS